MSQAKERIIAAYNDMAKAKCRVCGWEGTQGDCGFGHQDFYCPSCGQEAVDIAEPEYIHPDKLAEALREKTYLGGKG